MNPQQAGGFEKWAARTWNVFNEGRPFSIVYPVMVLVAAWLVGIAPAGELGAALLGALAVAVPLSRFSFPLRGRALLWLAAVASVPLLEPWRDLAMLAGALGGWVFFTVFFWGSLYYHLRTGAKLTNFTRFWRLVATNSDPTSGNLLEQVPKMVLSLSAATLLAERPGAGSVAAIAVVVAATAALGWIAWRRFERDVLPVYPERAARSTVPADVHARRVYVIVVDGANRERMWQAHTPAMDRLAREGTEYLGVDPAYPARTVVCFSSMLTGATPAEHGMRSNFAPRLGLRCESVFETLERSGKRGRLVGIAHLLDPFGEEVVRSVTSVQPTEQIDHSLTAAARSVVEDEDPDLLVLQLLAADQLGHVRGVRNPEYLEQMEQTDRHVGDFLAFLGERGKLERATVILMADHGQGRGIGGHGHLDWGERPVPFVVWGEGAVPGGVSSEPHSVLELAHTVAGLLDVDSPARARGHALIPAGDPAVMAGSSVDGRCLAIVVTPGGQPPSPRVLEAVPATACGMVVDTHVVGEHALSRALALARDGRYAAAVCIDGQGGFDSGELDRLIEPIARGRADYVLGSRFLDPHAGSRRHDVVARAASVLLGTLMRTLRSDVQTGFRALSARALHAADIGNAAGYPEVLMLALWGESIESIEVPVTCRRDRARGVGYAEYVGRVVPAVWRQWRVSRAARASAAAPIAPASTNGQTVPLTNDGSSEVSGPSGASGRGVTRPSEPSRTAR